MFWVVALLAVFLLYNFFKATSLHQEELTYSQFVKKVEEGTVAKVLITGKETLTITGEYRTDGAPVRGFRTTALNDDKLVGMLRAAAVDITVEEAREGTYLLTLMTWAPILLMLGLSIGFLLS